MTIKLNQPYVENNKNNNFGLFSDNNPIPLKSTDFSGHIKGMMTHMKMSLVFENQEPQSIEAVYTFPVPDDALFLGLTLKMDDQIYQTVVMERATATESYEETITDGNAAILLEEVSANLYSMQIGNIPAHSEIRIDYEYSLLHEWKGNLLRWRLPTVLAPRYGDSKLLPHHEPEVDLLVKHGFSFSLKVEGLLCQSICTSPSHSLNYFKHNDELVLSLNHETDLLNKDLIIQFQRQLENNDIITALWDRDREAQYCSLLSLCTPPVDNYSPKAKIVKILIDCSGSMAYESISQARLALSHMLQQIRPQDKVMIWKFGSSIEKLHNKPIPVSAIDKDIYHRITADLGGTELYSALTQMAQQGNRFLETESDIFLITDGEVWNDENAYNKLLKVLGKKQRIFSVGVGRAVSTEILNKLAKTSGGSVELVTVNENMADRITTHFKRLYSAKITSLSINWPMTPVYTEEMPVIFSGDTVYIGARFNKLPEGEVSVSAQYENGYSTIWQCDFEHKPFDISTEQTPSTLARTLASRQMHFTDQAQSLEIALNYQLLTENTACFADVILAEDKKSDGQPAIRKVPSMLAEGYAGAITSQLPARTRTRSPAPAAAASMEYLDKPAFLSKSSHSIEIDSFPASDRNFDSSFTPGASTPEESIPKFRVKTKTQTLLHDVEKFYLKHQYLPQNERDLYECGIDEETISKILENVTPDENKAIAILQYLYEVLISSPNSVSKSFARVIRTEVKKF